MLVAKFAASALMIPADISQVLILLMQTVYKYRMKHWMGAWEQEYGLVGLPRVKVQGGLAASTNFIAQLLRSICVQKFAKCPDNTTSGHHLHLLH